MYHTSNLPYWAYSTQPPTNTLTDVTNYEGWIIGSEMNSMLYFSEKNA